MGEAEVAARCIFLPVAKQARRSRRVESPHPSHEKSRIDHFEDLIHTATVSNWTYKGY